MAETPTEASGDAALTLLKEPKDLFFGSPGSMESSSDSFEVEVLSKLQVLKIFNAGLTELPTSLWNCRELRQLDVGGNPLGDAFPAAAVAAHLQNLEILFASKMGMTELPKLFDCPKLRMLGIKDNQLRTLDGNLLPETMEWLIAAGNQISSLPNLGRLKRVRKLMLSHNQLTCDTLAPVADIDGLEMLRVAANRLEAFPEALLSHKRLAWVALGANPMAEDALSRHLAAGFQSLNFKEVEMGEKLGSGAGATVYQGQWHGRTVAVKLWDAETFSDGTALSEWAANRVASQPGHEALVQVLGTFEDPRGMVLELLQNAKAAANPPNFATVTRDALPRHGAPGVLYTVSAARQIALRVSAAAEYLHSKGLMHGDIYLHNTLVIHENASSAAGTAVRDVRLSDFGACAAVDLPELRRLEVRSFGWLLQDLLECQTEPENEEEEKSFELMKALRARCAAEDPRQLPSFMELRLKLAA